MRGERGQAGVEWVGIVLLVALALAGLARLASRIEAAGLATNVVSTTTCAIRGGCGEKGHPAATRGRLPGEAVAGPPLVPVVPAPRSDGARRRAVPRPAELLRRARRPAGAFWRRAWLICFGYERLRYGLLHPETRPRQTVPISGTLQMVNDCASPIDFARDWELLRPR